MDAVLTMVGAAGIWLLKQLVGEILGELLRPLFEIVDRLLRWLLSPLVNPWGVCLLWLLAGVSMAMLPAGVAAESACVRTASLAGFMAATPIALVVTFTLRRRRLQASARRVR